MLMAAQLSAMVVTADFNNVQGHSLPSGYTENQITVTSPNGFNVVNGSFAATLFGWGGYTFTGKAIHSNNNGWIGISSGGETMSGVSFQYGFDWSGYLIEYGLMDVNVEWEAYMNGVMVDSGGLYFNKTNKSHGGGLSVSGLFDSLSVRSTAVIYQGIQGAVPGLFERGAVISATDLNTLALDNIRVTTRVPDAGMVWPLALLMILFFRRYVCTIR